ncbi:hypothetical protein [Gellertiella hungarica]|uniref:Leucine-binding protein domain-containing protein n=1 Tax=Gellertiella hungarica TaxID=1572859 RepID=A0A7W6NML0_9HYPH|nr:hypothetical protein [Gellertiella hungarica]MBB4066565.1 hypothetical protein [Gellertiella hungarica]
MGTARMGSTGISRGARWVFPVLGLLLAGCQTKDFVPASSGSKVPAATTAQQPAQAANQTFGAGAVRVGFLAIKRQNQSLRQADSDYRSGAAFAVNRLGGDAVQLIVREVPEAPAAISDGAAALGRQGVSFMLTTARGPEVDTVKAGLGGRPVPILSFQPNGTAVPESAHSFLSSQTDGLVEGASFAMAEGSSQAIVLYASPAEKPAAERVSAELRSFGAGVAPPVDVSGGSVSGRSIEAWNKVDMVVIMPGVKAPGDVIRRTDEQKPPRPGRRIVLADGMPQADMSHPKLTGSIACRFGQEVQARIGKSYLANSGMPASTDVGYGFDAMAMAIGLVNRWGEQAFSPEAMMAPEGFSGSLGVFRLEKAGHVRRTCDIFKIANGSYMFFQRAPSTL